MRNTRYNSEGFTLIEVLVSVSIFAMVMLMATSAVFSIVAANKKTHSLKSVMTNLNFALESMAREIRVGSDFKCLDASAAVVSDPVYGDCVNGNVGFLFTSNIAKPISGFYPLQYTFNQTDGRIYKQLIGSDSNAVAITASEIVIKSMKFYVVGNAVGKQPKVVMTIQGYAGVDTTQSSFNIETTVSQRSIGS